jgi:hypothetical protein
MARRLDDTAALSQDVGQPGHPLVTATTVTIERHIHEGDAGCSWGVSYDCVGTAVWKLLENLKSIPAI